MQDRNSGHQPRTSAVSHGTIILALRDASSTARGPLARLTKTASPPLDHAGLLTVIIGANTAGRAASLCLKTPNSAVTERLDELHCLAMACAAEYAARPGCVDNIDSVAGRFKANPAWALLWTIGAKDSAQDHPAVVAAGIELLLSLHRQKPMAAASCSGARLALSVKQLSGISLEALFESFQGERMPQWMKQCHTTYAEFLAAFDSAPHDPAPPRSFEDRARTELSCRAAFASYKRRAGVLDDTCLSRRQISSAVLISDESQPAG